MLLSSRSDQVNKDCPPWNTHTHRHHTLGKHAATQAHTHGQLPRFIRAQCQAPPPGDAYTHKRTTHARGTRAQQRCSAHPAALLCIHVGGVVASTAAAPDGGRDEDDGEGGGMPTATSAVKPAGEDAAMPEAEDGDSGLCTQAAKAECSAS